MKKAKDYLDTLHWSVTTKDDMTIAIGGLSVERIWYEKSDVEALIKQCQIDTIDTTVLKCSQNATTKAKYVSTGDYSGFTNWIVDERSIVDISEQLKKELE